MMGYFARMQTSRCTFLFLPREKFDTVRQGKMKGGRVNSRTELIPLAVRYLTIRLRARVFYEQIVNEAHPS